ncbi:hypothetical protein [Geminicoccus flavidas]|uniref:hypothetical protein n=1 Tax=Geminicoccus flavidas TaxID=2506407 RepID=UPI0013575431|nr:hypothetical protein [Geminicoccus flavidas]
MKNDSLLRIGVGFAVLTSLMVLLPSSGQAGDPCVDPYGNTVPNCQEVSVTVGLKTFETKGWALYCPNNAYYYWGGYNDVWQHSPHVFWENAFGEGGNKADFTLTNTHLGSNSVTITIGCSPFSQGGSCTGARTTWSDPGCPENNRRRVCAGDGEDQQCWEEWDEECVSNGNVTDWACTQALFKTMCVSC